MQLLVEHQKVDFIITNPGSYAQLEAEHGVSRLATIRKKFNGSDNSIYGAVIFTRSDSQIETIKDLVNKRFIAVHNNAFGGWWMAKREIAHSGISENELSSLKFIGFPQDQVVKAVLNGEADAGTVRTGIIEQLIAEKKLAPDKIKIINAQKNTLLSFQA